MESLICNARITQMLGVICQPGLSRWAQAALRGGRIGHGAVTFLPLLTMQEHANINPILALSSIPAFLLASRGVLSSIWTVAGRGGAVGGLLSWPVWGNMWHQAHQVLLLPCIRIGNDGMLSEALPGFPRVWGVGANASTLCPQRVCVSRARKRGRECESPLCPSVL